MSHTDEPDAFSNEMEQQSDRRGDIMVCEGCLQGQRCEDLLPGA